MGLYLVLLNLTYVAYMVISAPEYDSDGFNFHAWEAMGYGIPTFVADQSGIATTIKVK